MKRELPQKEGIFAGILSSAAVKAFLKFMEKYPEIKRLVSLLSDIGEHYLSVRRWEE